MRRLTLSKKISCLMFVGAFGASLANAEAQSQAADSACGFVADRPGTADNPRTICPGCYRLESGLLASQTNWMKNGDSPSIDQTYGSLTLVRGLTDRSELQLGFDGSRRSDDGTTVTSGAGGGFARAKVKVAGECGQSLEVAVIPKIAYTGAIGKPYLSGGLNIPVTVLSTELWTVTVMPEWDIVRSENATGTNQFTFGAVANYAITPSLSAGFEEGLTILEGQSATALEGVALAIMLNSKLQLDLSFDAGRGPTGDVTRYSGGFVYAF